VEPIICAPRAWRMSQPLHLLLLGGMGQRMRRDVSEKCCCFAGATACNSKLARGFLERSVDRKLRFEDELFRIAAESVVVNQMSEGNLVNVNRLDQTIGP
jgi:hypothetical protein